ncbi:MAG: MATE family efflux transporter, partial [bacterium]
MNQPKSSRQLSLLLEGSIFQMFWRLAGPNVLGVVMTILVTFCDAWFVADLGTVALASLALVFPFQTLIVFMAAGAIGGGVTSAISRTLGRGALSEVSALAWHAVVIGISMSLLFILTLGLFPQEIFQGMGGTGEVLTGAVSYAQIAFGGSIVTWMLYILAAVFRGSGDTLTPARMFIVGCSCQIFFSGAFTLGWGPFPEMGVIGPAIALIICHAGMALFLASHLYLGKGLLQLKPSPLRLVFFIDIMRVGGIGLINNVTVAFSVVVVTAILGHFGAAALAGYGLGSRLELMLTPLVFGVGSALTAGVGANVGAQNFQRARSIAWAGASIAFLVTGGIGIMVAVIPELWLDWFTADDAAYEVA